jgi:putative acetyltransferase
MPSGTVTYDAAFDITNDEAPRHVT